VGLKRKGTDDEAKGKEEQNMERKDKINYYLDIADAVRSRSTCLRRQYGAIIVNHDEIVATGYTGAPRGRKNCIDIGQCAREILNIPSGERYELCRSVHAEANAIISAARSQILGGTLYLAGREVKTGELLKTTTPCSMCRRLIINAGIKEVICRTAEDEYSITNVRDWVYEDDSLKGLELVGITYEGMEKQNDPQ
jgi:dCMP deaminase